MKKSKIFFNISSPIRSWNTTFSEEEPQSRRDSICQGHFLWPKRSWKWSAKFSDAGGTQASRLKAVSSQRTDSMTQIPHEKLQEFTSKKTSSHKETHFVWFKLDFVWRQICWRKSMCIVILSRSIYDLCNKSKSTLQRRRCIYNTCYIKLWYINIYFK